jgi:hypothetical protein
MPTKYKKEYCDMLVKHMAKGGSFKTFGVDIDVASSNLYVWVNDYEEFRIAKEKGYAAGLRFYEQLLQSASMGMLPEQLKNMGSKGINLSAVIFALKTRFHKDYGEISIVENTGSNEPIQVNFVKPDDPIPVEPGEVKKIEE